MSDDLTRLTDDEQEQILDAIWTKRDDGPNGYPVMRWGIDFPVVESILAARTAALIDRAERAERERDQWKDRMWVSVRERAVWSHEAGQHTGDIPFHHCPICEASFHRSELAALRAAVTGLADEVCTCEGETCDEDRGCFHLRALLTDEGDSEDGVQVQPSGSDEERDGADVHDSEKVHDPEITVILCHNCGTIVGQNEVPVDEP